MRAEFRLLGPLEVCFDGAIVPLRSPKQRGLLADLLLHHRQVVSIDTLVEDLWGAAPPTGSQHALETHVSKLRHVVGATLVARPPGYVLEVDAESIDIVRFERLLAGGNQAWAEKDARHGLESAEAALALWRGPPLADFTYEPFAQIDIGRLEELRWNALELHVDCELALGRGDLVSTLEAHVASAPFRERLHAQLMLALYREGRQAEALNVYRALHALLDDELGIEPGEELRNLEAAILRQDPALALPPDVPRPRRRKLVTILAAELVDRSGLRLSLDPEALQDVLGRYFAAVSDAVERHGGTGERALDHSLLAVFGAPVAHEDDALRAARAALEARAAVAALDEQLERERAARLEVRLAVATGEALSDGSTIVTGPAVAVAGSLVARAQPGEILVDGLTQQLAGDGITVDEEREVELPGRRVHTGRLTGLVARGAIAPRRLNAPLVGRERELGRLRNEFGRASRERGTRTVVVSGPAGIGKSRLVHELLRALPDEATVLRGSAVAYGESGGYGALRTALRSPEEVAATVAGAADGKAIADRLAIVFGLDSGTPAEELPWALRRYCEVLARTQPLVVALDDLHWAEPELVQAIAQLRQAADAPILLLCATRDEFTEEEPELLPDAERVVLEALDDDAAVALADHLLESSALERRLREEIVGAAEGNPLFLEQLVAHVRETGDIETPPTLRALLAARLDRLGPGERVVLDHAAVVGRDFDVRTVKELLEPAASARADEHLGSLVHRGFLRAAGGMRFRHGLIHDAVYRSSPKVLRADLHERLADIVQRRGADDEQIGYHLEQSYLMHADLGRADRHTRGLAEDAGRRLGAAGIRTWKLGEAARASRLLGRAAALLPERDEQRRELLCELGIALNTSGDPHSADARLDEAARLARDAHDRRIELRASLERAGLELVESPSQTAAALLSLSTAAIAVFDSVGDERALGRAHMLAGWVQGGLLGRNRDWGREAEQALIHYRRAGWPQATCVGHIVEAAYWGPTPVATAIARCMSLLEGVTDRQSEANLVAHLGGLRAMRGEFDDAERLLEHARALYADLGQEPKLLATCVPLEAAALRLAGRPQQAAAILRTSCGTLQRDGLRYYLATQAGELAELLATLEQPDEAAEWCDIAERCASRDDVVTRLWCGAARLRLFALRGNRAQGRRIADATLHMMEGTDAPNLRALVHTAHARLLHAAGDDERAAGETHMARRLFEQKGNAAAVALLDNEATAAAGIRA